MQERIEVDAPSYPEDLRHEEARRVFVPESSTHSLYGWQAKVVGKTGDPAIPRSLLSGASQLIEHGSPDQHYGQRPQEYVPRAKDSIVAHSFTPFSKNRASGFLS